MRKINLTTKSVDNCSKHSFLFINITEVPPTDKKKNAQGLTILGFMNIPLTHPSPWNGTPDVWLVTQVFVGDVIFRTDQDSTGTITASRYYQ